MKDFRIALKWRLHGYGSRFVSSASVSNLWFVIVLVPSSKVYKLSHFSKYSAVLLGNTEEILHTPYGNINNVMQLLGESLAGNTKLAQLTALARLLVWKSTARRDLLSQRGGVLFQ